MAPADHQWSAHDHDDPLAAIAPYWNRLLLSLSLLVMSNMRASIRSSHQQSAPPTFAPAGRKHSIYTVDVATSPQHVRKQQSRLNRQHYCSAAILCSAAHPQLAARTTRTSGPASTLFSRTFAILTRTTVGRPPQLPHDDILITFPYYYPFTLTFVSQANPGQQWSVFSLRSFLSRLQARPARSLQTPHYPDSDPCQPAPLLPAQNRWPPAPMQPTDGQPAPGRDPSASSASTYNQQTVSKHGSQRFTSKSRPDMRVGVEDPTQPMWAASQTVRDPAGPYTRRAHSVCPDRLDGRLDSDGVEVTNQKTRDLSASVFLSFPPSAQALIANHQSSGVNHQGGCTSTGIEGTKDGGARGPPSNLESRHGLSIHAYLDPV